MNRKWQVGLIGPLEACISSATLSVCPSPRRSPNPSQSLVPIQGTGQHPAKPGCGQADSHSTTDPALYPAPWLCLPQTTSHVTQSRRDETLTLPPKSIQTSTFKHDLCNPKAISAIYNRQRGSLLARCLFLSSHRISLVRRTSSSSPAMSAVTKGVILVGGPSKGTRMRPLTLDCKCRQCGRAHRCLCRKRER